MISEAYRQLNADLHGSDASYGTSGQSYAQWVGEVAQYLKTTSILDYGCGKRTLEQALGFAIANYDPAVPGSDARPTPADLVVCTDVLEHVEPDELNAVLADLAGLTKRVVFLAVATGPAQKTLADGRNAHLIQQPWEWWQEKIEAKFRLLRLWDTGRGFLFIGQSLRDTDPRVINLNHIGPPPNLTKIVCKSAYTDEQRASNIRSAMLRGLPVIPLIPAHDNRMVLACYGPSLTDQIDAIRAEVAAGADLYTVSGAHRVLIKNGLIPKGHIESDPRPHKAKLIGEPHKGIVYFLASACSREVFDLVHGHETWVYHVTSTAHETNLIAALDNPDTFTVDGGTNVGMSALGLGTALGYRRFSVYAMDCSYVADPDLLNWPKDQDFPPELQAKVQCHAGPHPNEDQPLYRVWVGDKPFLTSPQLLQGAQDMLALKGSARHLTIDVKGNGFLPSLIQHVKGLKAAA